MGNEICLPTESGATGQKATFGNTKEIDEAAMAAIQNGIGMGHKMELKQVL